MSMSGAVVVKFNHVNTTKAKMTAEGMATVKRILEDVAAAVEMAAFYPEVECRVDMKGKGGNVEISPWWIGFVEFGTAHRGARPFAGKAADRVFAKASGEFKALEKVL